MQHALADIRGTIDDEFVVDRKMQLGLYATYALVGLVNGVFLQNLIKPICLYVFEGALNKNVTFAQCNIAPFVFQMPWMFKVFYAVVLDKLPLMGSRRYSWIVLGWGAALCCLGVICFWIRSLVAVKSFALYNALLMGTCALYMFAEVSVDGLTIELSQSEPEHQRGKLIVNSQIVRFVTTASVLVGSAILLNGSKMYPSTLTQEGLFDFGLSLEQLHWTVLGLAIPLYLMVVCFLRDPPDRGQCQEYDFRELAAAFWDTLQSKAMLFMIVFNIGFVAIAGLGNPAAVAVATIVAPTPLQLNLAAFVSKVLFVCGIWIFRRFFMARNWRVTCCWIHVLLLLEGAFYLLVIYDIDGIGQSGLFYCFGDCPINMIVGMSQVVSLLAAAEISKSGLEATTYELLTTMHNVAIALNANIGNSLLAVFDINQINYDSYEAARSTGTQGRFNEIMSNATIVTMGIQLLGTMIFVWLLPQDMIMCRIWRDDIAWRTHRVGALGFLVAFSAFCYSITLSTFVLVPATRCLKLVGGQGCHF